MDGIVLLDDEQQRALNPASVRGAERTAPSFASSGQAGRQRQQSDAPTTVSATSSDHRSFATLGGSTGKPSIATLGSPRTNFTTREGAQSRHVPPPIDTQSIQDDTTVDPWMFDELTPESLDGSTIRESTESQDTSMKLILAGLALGVVLGLILQALKVSPVVAQWIGLPCELFLRALFCIVVPYVFCSVAVAIGDIVYVGKISIVGYQTARIFVTFWITTSVMGMGIALLFRPMFNAHTPVFAKPANAMGFTCANQQFMTVLTNGSLACSTDLKTLNVTGLPPSSTFQVTDLTGAFGTKTNAAAIASQSLGELLRNLILYSVSPNLTASFVKGELLSLIVAAMVLGSIAGRSYFNKTRRVNYLFLTLVQLRDTFLLMLEWVTALTPVAVVSFMASFLATSMAVFNATHVYFYVLAAFSAAFLHLFVLLPTIVFLLTQCNPYKQMKPMARAYVFAFACSSSIATAPVSISCIKRARVCSQSLYNFVVSIGACSNTSASGFYVPIAVIFLAESAGDAGELTALRLAGIFAMSLLACFSTPPIPAGGLVMVMAVYSALFGVSEMPPGFIYVMAADFIVDRMATVCNVHDDIMALKIIAENTDETVVQEHLGERC